MFNILWNGTQDVTERPFQVPRAVGAHASVTLSLTEQRPSVSTIMVRSKWLPWSLDPVVRVYIMIHTDMKQQTLKARSGSDSIGIHSVQKIKLHLQTGLAC